MKKTYFTDELQDLINKGITKQIRAKFYEIEGKYLDELHNNRMSINSDE